MTVLARYMPLLWNINPNTGDRNATILWVVIAVLVVSGIVIAAMLATSRKNKRKR